MLNNHSISIQNGFNFKLIFHIILLFSIIGCSSISTLTSKQDSSKRVAKQCSFSPDSIDQKHVLMAARIKSSVLTNCFRNYLRFEKIKKQKISICNRLSIKKGGTVSYVQVVDAFGKNLPKDFKMCVVQEYWKMNFSGLQIIRSHMIKFQLNFSSI